MQIICMENNLHELLMPIFLEKKGKISLILQSAEFALGVATVDYCTFFYILVMEALGILCVAIMLAGHIKGMLCSSCCYLLLPQLLFFI